MQDKTREAAPRRWERRFQEGRTWEEALYALIRAQREGERA